jgi:hypothetical protein
MPRQSACPPRRRSICRRTAPAAVALVASVAVCFPAFAAASSTTIVVSGDSIVASSLPSFGQATIQATRPDALTGKPVVIGQYSGSGNPLGPLSVNATTPTPLNSSGDCWQQGALSMALTPDLQPGDTITLTQAAGFFGGSSSPTSAVVPQASPNSVGGPISGCSSIAPWARNVITSAPSSVTNGPIAVSGLAQPLATEVAVSASDGTHASAPVTVTPASDGSWSATIPAAKLKGLADTTLTVTPVVAVPDVSTGAAAHIAGVAASVKKSPAADGGNAQQPAPAGQPASTAAGQPVTSPRTSARKLRVTTVRTTSSLTLAAARSHGITASFRVPSGATTVEVELLQGAKPMYLTIVRAGKAGSVQTVRLGGGRLGRGHYTIAVKAGTSRSAFGAASTHGLTIR